MKIVQEISNLPTLREKKYGVVIGNFDGLHLGHQRFLLEIKKECRSLDQEVVVVVFIPHPLVILKNKEHFLLNSYKERQNLIEELGVDWLVEIPFSRDLSMLGPDKFLDEYILSHEGVRGLFLGHDFAFGANKKGDHHFVQEHCRHKDIFVKVQGEFSDKNRFFSSSHVRKALESGRAEEAAKILGRPFFLAGRVIKGAGRGRQIGFPTANIEVGVQKIIPEYGVYATKTFFRGGSYKSITNIGLNPTFLDSFHVNVETNIFDFEGDLYGEEISVSFLKKIRNEIKFPSVNELIEQIKRDVKRRREFND